MNDDQLNVAVAQYQGWRIANPENDRTDYRTWLPPGKEAEPNVMHFVKPPIYTKSRDACAEFEATIMGEELYVMYLAREVLPNRPLEGWWDLDSEESYWVATAEPIPRCRAYVKYKEFENMHKS